MPRFQTEIEVMHENQENILKQMQTMRQRMKTMTQHNERLEAMLFQLMRAQGVEFVEEDDLEEDLHLVNANWDLGHF